MRVFLLLLPFITELKFALSAQRLNDYIKHFEPLTYDKNEIHEGHLRAKRSITDPFLHINFHAHGRHFNLRLKRDTEVLAKDLIVEGPNGEQFPDLDLSHVYSGDLWGEESTKVYGSVREGVFEGKIHTPKATYYVERSKKVFSGVTQPFHSVIYKEEDVKHPKHYENIHPFGGCGVTEDVYQWMQDVSNSAAPESNNYTEPEAKPKQEREKREASPDNPHYKYTEQAQKHVSYYPDVQSPREKRTCTLFIQTDTYLWDHVYGYEQKESNVREEITSLIWQHVKAVNTIYQSTSFEVYRGIRFTVQRIRINDTSACNTTEKRATNPFCLPNIDVSNFLNLNSQSNHDDFCLAYIFTYRDFSGGTLGLAWVASVSGSSGGICEKYKSYIDKNGGREINIKRSLNTGVITFVNYNTRVPPKVSELTLAHEIGHNFGSPHDYPLDCRPGGKDGNFIMYASATSGDRANNNKFSHCSQRNISAVLTAVFRNEGKANCFQVDAGPFCGNKIVEDQEECDCGYDKDECNEECCYPHEISPYLVHDRNAKPCRLKPRTQCSPSQGPCCSPQCKFVDSRTLCKKDSDCNQESYCNGRDATCPTPTPKPNRTICNEGTQVCWSGECTGSICEKYAFEECFLTEDNAKPEEMCQVACQEPNRTDTCKATLNIESMKQIRGIKLRPGSPCNDFKGYCDVFQKCRDVDAEGPLARLKNLLFNQKTLMTIRQWVTNHWWGVLLMLLGLIIFMAFFIKCFAVHTPSSNPRKAPALRIQDTLRRPADTLRRKRHHHQQRQQQRQQERQQQQQAAAIPPQAVHQQPSQHQPQQHQPLPNSARQQQSVPSGPPPPYPGRSNPVAAANVVPPGRPPTAPPASAVNLAGPSHGYGEGRGLYNRRERAVQNTPVKQQKARTSGTGDETTYAGVFAPRSNALEMRPKSKP